MAKYFGSVSPAQSYRTKVRWILAGFSSVVAVLFFALIYVLTLPEHDMYSASVSTTQLAHASQIPSVEVLVAMKRIESGARLDSGLFRSRSLPPDMIPADAIRAQEGSGVWGKFSAGLILAGAPLGHADVTEQRDLATFPIPPGYRASTIVLAPDQIVAGYVRPDSRVDVLIHYKDSRGRRTVDTLIEFARVLSVNAGSDPGEKKAVQKRNTVTLLVSEHDSKRLELARGTAKLSLSLRGDLEGSGGGALTGPVTASHIWRNKQEDNIAAIRKGTIYYTDPRTGQQLRRVLELNKWSSAETI